MIIHYLNAADVLVLTSFKEGSPNVIKEAMACNCPIVSTDVGDVRELIENLKGCFITSFDPTDVANKIILALDFRDKYRYTTGRDRILSMGLDSKSIAEKMAKVY